MITILGLNWQFPVSRKIGVFDRTWEPRLNCPKIIILVSNEIISVLRSLGFLYHNLREALLTIMTMDKSSSTVKINQINCP